MSVLDTYYSQLERANLAKREKRLADMAAISEESCRNLPAVVQAMRRELGGPPVFPMIAYAAWRWSALGQLDKLAWLRERVLAAGLPDELHEVEDAIEKAALADQIAAFIGANPGILQSKLWKAAGVNGTKGGGTLWEMTRHGRVRAEPVGKTFALHLVTL